MVSLFSYEAHINLLINRNRANLTSPKLRPIIPVIEKYVDGDKYANRFFTGTAEPMTESSLMKLCRTFTPE